jgi:hypothetical protein
VDVGDLEEPGVVRLDLRVQAPVHLGRLHLRPRGGDAGAAAAAGRALRLHAAKPPYPCRERDR